ncbi:hypothetical protein ACTNEQ_03305 [Blautia obeum]|uniref:hypothetical protein n=1 Tax=Blautia obeum TaxID=40520 RepID=UPI003F8BCF1E
MKILVINGDCLLVNSSANLCHLAYINGLVNCGYEVTVLFSDGLNYSKDKSMQIPEEVHMISYDGMSLYEKLSMKRKKTEEIPSEDVCNNKKGIISIKEFIIKRIKKVVLNCYGVHGIYAPFIRKAKKYKNSKKYDYLISISTPPSSHLLAYKLLKKKNIHAKRWIQIWEDPWCSDVYGFNGKRKIFREERRILSFAEKVCYVSPLTLKKQKQLFPESAHKMFWQPLPFYYQNNIKCDELSNEKHYGYFGDYIPASRDLEPFYIAAKETGIDVNICGNPNNLFQPTEKIHIYPRLPLNELKMIEDDTNVLVFLCNRQGGQIPGKIYQYSATEKTILFILDGTEDEKRILKKYFGKFNRYIFCENTVEDITRAISIINEGQIGCVKDYPLDYFEPQKIIQKVLNATGEEI